MTAVSLGRGGVGVIALEKYYSKRTERLLEQILTSLLGVWLCNEGGQRRAAILLFLCSFFLEWKGVPSGTGSLSHISCMRRICIHHRRRPVSGSSVLGGTDSPRAQEKVRNLWVLINLASHTAFHVY